MGVDLFGHGYELVRVLLHRQAAEEEYERVAAVGSGLGRLGIGVVAVVHHADPARVDAVLARQ